MDINMAIMVLNLHQQIHLCLLDHPLRLLQEQKPVPQHHHLHLARVYLNSLHRLELKSHRMDNITKVRLLLGRTAAIVLMRMPSMDSTINMDNMDSMDNTANMGNIIN